MTENKELPPYTIVRQRFPWVTGNCRETEIVAVKRIDGRWDLVGSTPYWFNSDEELFEQWSEAEIIGIGIFPDPF